MVETRGAVELARGPWVNMGNGVEVYRGQAETLTAAAKRIDFGSKEEQQRYKKRQKGWTDEAWRYYDENGEVWFASNFVANCLSKIRIFGAQQPDKSQPPTPIGPEDSAELRTAAANVDRLHQADGGMAAIMGRFGLLLSVPGEAVLVGSEDPATQIETWKVHSADEVFVNNRGNWAVRDAPTDRKGRELDPETTAAYRVWRQHPRWSGMADSPLRALLDVIEELQILSRAIRASGRSRLAGAGMLLWPSEATLGTMNPGQQQTGGQNVDPVLADLMTAMMTPISDEGVAAAVVPLLTRMPGERIAQVKHLLFDRPIDPQLASQREELIRRMANGLDIPAQVLLGVEDVNHWTGWLIDEQTFKQHLEPLVMQICGSLTSEFLRPAFPPEVAQDILVWYDASELIAHPNRAQDTKDAHDRLLISDDAARRELGFSDEDAPTSQEIEERVARKALEKMGALRAGETIGESVKVSSTQAQDRGIPATGDSGGAPALAAAGMPELEPVAPTPLVAAARSRRTHLGRTLARRDRDLRVRLITAADAAMFRALERAGATLRRRTSRNADLQAAIGDVANWQVAVRLGAAVCEPFSVETQEVLTDSFDSFGMRFDRETQQAQQQLRTMLSDFDDAGTLDEDAIAQQQAESRRDAGLLLVGALSALATARLFNPHPEAPPLGEHDPELMVPPGYLREALAVAGGSPPPDRLDGHLDGPAGGIATGDLASDVWDQLGVSFAGYEWVVGAPDRPFEPHQDLEGEQFSSFDDDALLSDSGEFPFVDHYFPGDHDGCQCDFTPITEEQ